MVPEGVPVLVQAIGTRVNQWVLNSEWRLVSDFKATPITTSHV